MTNKEKIIKFWETEINNDEDIYNLLDLWNEDLDEDIEIHENCSPRCFEDRIYDYNIYLHCLYENYNTKDKYIFYDGQEFWSGNDILNYIDLEKVADYCIQHHDNLGAEELDEWVK